MRSYLTFMSDEEDSASYKLSMKVKEILGNDYDINSRFFNKFHNAIYDDLYRTFSSIARRNLDFEEVDYDIKDALKNVGLKYEDLEKHKNLIIKCSDVYNRICGYMDIILYNLGAKGVRLGGNDIDYVSKPEEVIIKYCYSYHNTNYGRLFIRQYYGNYTNYIRLINDGIVEYLISHDLFKLNSEINYRNILDEIKEECEEENCFSVDNNIWTLNYEKFFFIMKRYASGMSYEDTRKFFEKFVEYINGYLSDEIEDYNGMIRIHLSL